MIGTGPYLRFSNAFEDLAGTPSELRAVFVMAWDDVTVRYRRTLLGPWWMALAHLVLMLGIGYLLGNVFKQAVGHYVLYVGLGLTSFAPIVGALAEGPGLFLRYKNWILGTTYPLSSYAVRSLINIFVVMAHQVPAIALLWIVFKQPVSWTMPLAIPGLLLMGVFSTGVMLFLAPIGTRFRDLAPATQALTSLLTILTPIYWEKTAATGAGSLFLLANPAYHLMQVVRAPLLGEVPTTMNWTISIGAAVFMFVLGVLSMWRSYWRISVSL